MNKNFSNLLMTCAVTLCLAASGVASAQSSMGNAASTGATFSVGVVESIATDSVTIVQDSGERVTVLLGSHTVGKQYLNNGRRVRIDFRNNENGRPVAEEIEIGGQADVKVAAVPMARVPDVVVAPTVRYEAPRTEPVAAAPYVAERTIVEPTPERRPYDLPATAGQTPTIALLGLLALAGAVALRVAR